MKTLAMLACSAILSATSLIALPPLDADAAVAKKYQNCTALNKKYAHGVARPGARDKVRGKTRPVTGFAVNKAVYQRNTHLDRDKDGVACEKR
jgi:hypothetical protein